MGLVEKAAWIIERNLGSELDLDRLAEACGVSKFHLSHAFAQTAGQPLIRYLRGRRLSEAAMRLVRDAPEILPLAIESGYGSHEAFTRAFQDRFGLGPGEVKQRKTLGGLKLTEPLMHSTTPPSELAEPRRERPGAMTFVALSQPHEIGHVGGIPRQWQEFMQRYGEIDGIVDPMPWGIGFPPDETGRFDYACGVRVRPSGVAVPAGLIRLQVAPQLYLVFLHAEHVARIPATYKAIWSDWLPESGFEPAQAPTLERHCKSFDPSTGLGGVEIWLPVLE